MGYHAELNTLLRPPPGFDYISLQKGKRYIVTLERERVFPLHIALLLIDKDWNFYGYAAAHSSTVKEGKTIIEFEMLSIFSPEEQILYKQKFIEAAKLTGEIT